MLVLGIDSATRIASVGLICDGESLAETSAPAVSNHTETLLPLVRDLLVHSGVTLPDVQGIGVSIGPGSFTGLRIALGTVKGFAYALGQRIVGVSTLEALASTVHDWQGTICSVLDARKGEVYVAFFRREQGGPLIRLTPDRVCSPQVLVTEVQWPCLFLGDGVEAYGALIRDRCGPAAQLLPFPDYPPRGTAVARLAWQRFTQGQADDLGSLEPRYVRKSEAEFKRAS
jgi:tRNA threonylcarbamoyladenosine biosynthesis protein TsaB